MISIFSTPGMRASPGDVDLVVEVADVPDDRLVLHAGHVARHDDVLVAGGGDEDVTLGEHRLELRDLVAVHGRLQRADGVDLGDDDAGTLAAQCLGRALADIAVAAHDGDLAADQDVRGPVEAVGQGVADAVLVVELGLRHGVVDVDRREQELALRRELVQAVHARRRLLSDALDPGGDRRPLLRLGLDRGPQGLQEHRVLVRVVGVALLRIRRHRAERLELGALVHEHRGVAAVVQDHVGAEALGLARPGEDLRGGPPVVLEGFVLPREHGDAGGFLDRAVPDDDGGRGLVLRGEDVARRPADLGAEGGERLDEDGRLHGHVERSGDPGARKGLCVGVFAAQGHEPGHLVLREADLVPPRLGE
ncbi:hypothetical protein QFZ50_000466 [Arthrobacter agilis]|nr:hypothetical protein [Arthrobacter agilis]